MKENPSRTDETKITPTSYILLGLYSSRNADISVPQFFHFLPWEPHSPKPGAWSGSRVQCSDLTLDWTWAKVQNMKTILLQTITYPLFLNSRHHLSSGGKCSCSQILKTPTHLWGLMFNLSMTVLCQDGPGYTCTSLVGCGNQGAHTPPPHQEFRAASLQSCRQAQICHWSPPLASFLQATPLGTAGFMHHLLSGTVNWKCEYKRHKYKKAQKKQIF